MEKICGYYHIGCGIISIISLIFLIIQSSININFNNSNDTNIITEKLLYEQIYDYINNNLNSHLILDIKLSNNDKCPEDYSELKVKTKLEKYYDCKNIDKKLKNKLKNCKNTINNLYECCEDTCCKENPNTGDTTCRNYYEDDNDYHFNDDIREGLCQKFSKNTGYMNYLYGQKICAKYSDKNFTEILNSDNVINEIGKKDCGILSPSNIHYYVNQNEDCPINCFTNDLHFRNCNISNGLLFVENVISDINYFPWPIEWDELSIFNLKKYKINKNNYIEKIKKRDDITLTNIKKFVTNSIYQIEDLNITKIDIIQEKKNHDSLFLKQIQLNQNIEKYFKLSWFHMPYIGVDSIKQVEDIYKFFYINNNENMDKLNKFVLHLYPSLEVLIPSIILIILLVIYIIMNFFILKNNSKQIDYYSFILEIIIVIFLLILLITSSVFMYRYTKTFNKFNLNYFNNENLKDIMKMYNKRRKQPYLLISLIIIVISFIVYLISLIFHFLIICIFNTFDRQKKEENQAVQNQFKINLNNEENINSTKDNKSESQRLINTNQITNSNKSSRQNDALILKDNIIRTFQNLDVTSDLNVFIEKEIKPINQDLGTSCIIKFFYNNIKNENKEILVKYVYSQDKNVSDLINKFNKLYKLINDQPKNEIEGFYFNGKKLNEEDKLEDLGFKYNIEVKLKNN